MKTALVLLWISVPAVATPFLETLDTIVERDPRVGQQRAAVSEIRGRTLSDQWSLLPELSGVVSYSVAGGDATPTTTRQRAGLSLGVNLFRFGADFSRMSAADHEVDSAQWALKTTILTVEADAARSLFALFAVEQKVKILRQILKTREQTLKVARRRFQRGLGAREEISATEIDLENARAQLKDAEIEQVSAENRLEALLGKPISIEKWPWRTTLTTKDLSTALKGDTKQLELRPDWRSAKAAKLAAEERQDQAWGGIFPSLDASIDYGFLRTRFQGATTEGPQWSGSLSLTIPLFDRLVNYGSFRAATARAAAAKQRLTGVQRKALQEWQTAERSLEIAKETAESREKTLSIARRLYEANLNRFNRGLVNANALRVDQDRFYQSELFAIQGWNAAHLNLLQLCHSLGKRAKECIHGKSQPR